MLITEIKTTDLNKNKKYIFVVSLGATEQHGPFLPLGTDTYIHDEIIKRVNRKLPEIIFLPTLPITCSKEHKGFPGSLWLEEKTLHDSLRNICESIKDNANKIIFITSHGGNVGALNRFINKEKNNFKPAKLFYIELENKEIDKKIIKMIKGPIDEHAGNTEISMMLSIKPRLVKKPDNKKHPKKYFNHIWETHYVIKNNPNGVVDAHSKWVISKKIGSVFIELESELLIKELKKLSANDRI